MAVTMAVPIPVLGLSPASKPLQRHAPISCASNSVLISSLCRVRTNRASTRRALRRDGYVSNSCSQLSELQVASVLGGESDEHCSGSGRSAEELSAALGRVCKASALAVAASFVSSGASLADEVVAASAVDTSDVGISTTVSVLFVVATIGLVVLTGGVIYLGLTEFLEKRALQEEQKKEEVKPKKPTKAKVKAAARAGGPKGFGSPKVTKGDDEEMSN